MIPSQDTQAVMSFWQSIIHMFNLLHHHTHAIRVAIGDNAELRLIRRAVDFLIHKALGTV